MASILLVGRDARGIEAAHQRSHAGAHDEVDGNAELFQYLEHADVRHPPGAAAGEDEADFGTAGYLVERRRVFRPA